MNSQTVAENAVGVLIDGDSNSVTIFSGKSKLLLDKLHKRRLTEAPASERHLLVTEYRATTLIARDDELAALSAWRKSAPPIGVRCITGRAGSGKTRLAIEACEQAEAEEWAAGFVSGKELLRFHGAQNLAQWREPRDALVVIDDAAASAGILKDWFDALARRSGGEKGGKLRILLLERHADADADYGWWADLNRSEGLSQAGSADLIGDERPVSLSPVARPEERRALLADAMRLAAGYLGKPAIEPPAAGANGNFDRRLADDRLENEPLFLIMAGILAVERGAPAALALGRTKLAEVLAKLERDRLRDLGARRGLPPDGDLIAHLAACITLQRGCDFAAAIALVDEELEAMKFASPLPAERLVEILAEALPGPAGEIGHVQPNLIGGEFVVREVTGSSVGRLDSTRQSIVERAYARDRTSVVGTLVRAAQDLAAGASDHPSVRWLRVIATQSDSLDELTSIAESLPYNSLALAELGAFVFERIIEIYRSRTADTGFGPSFPDALIEFAYRLGQLGHCDAALKAIEEGELYYQVFSLGQPIYAHALAAARERLALGLLEVGRLEEALVQARDVVGIYRFFALPRSDAYTVKLAGSLNTLAISLSALDQLEAAVAAAQEAVDLGRTLSAAGPDASMSPLAGSLNCLSNCLGQLGQNKPALAAARESNELYRTLAAMQPDAFMPDLARSLNNLAICLGALGLDEAALAAARESTDHFRTLAKARPDTFNPEWAMALENLSNWLCAAEQRREGIAAAKDAVDLSRTLAAARPDAFTSYLASRLQSLSNHLRIDGQREAALTAAEEAVCLRRALAAGQTDNFTLLLAESLTRLAVLLSEMGRGEPALRAAQEAVELYRIVAVEQPEVSRALVASLDDLALALGDQGQPKEALAAARTALTLLRTLTEGQSEPTKLGTSLFVLTEILETVGLPIGAVATDRESGNMLASRFLATPLEFGKPGFTMFATPFSMPTSREPSRMQQFSSPFPPHTRRN